MTPTLVVLLLCVVGALCIVPEHLWKPPPRTRTRPSLGVINGNKTTVKKYPFIAAVNYYGLQGAAIILDKNWLLTSATLTQWVPIMKFRVGSRNYDSKGQVVTASKVYVHPNHTGYDYDIAVVKTADLIQFNDKVKPVKLGTKKLQAGTKAWTVGWGYYNSKRLLSLILREAQVTVYDWGKCQELFVGNLTERSLCTLDKNTAACNYDWGNPLVVNGVLYGVVTGGDTCYPNYPTIYADVSTLYEWVQGIIKSDKDEEAINSVKDGKINAI